MTGDQAIPVERDHLADEGLGLQREDVDEAAAEERTDRNGVDHEDDLFLGQPHHDVRIGMVEAKIDQLERRAAELDRLLVVEELIWHHGERVFGGDKMRLDVLVPDDARARILERLAAGRMIEMMVTVNQVLDWL